MRCSLHAEALAEYQEATLYYAGRAPGLAEAFTKEVETTIAALQTSPRARAANERGTRRFLLRRFPYLVHYAIEQDPTHGGEEFIVVYAVRHARRDPDAWLYRLPLEPPPAQA